MLSSCASTHSSSPPGLLIVDIALFLQHMQAERIQSGQLLGNVIVVS